MFANFPAFVDKIPDQSVVILLFHGRMTMLTTVPFRIEHRHHLLLGEYLGELGVVIFADVESFTLVFQMFFEFLLKILS